jgi:predicted ATP-binding protein involved in virulence
MKIQQLHLQNFRGFVDTTIEFPNSNLCVLIGANGKGKSSVLDALDGMIRNWNGYIMGEISDLFKETDILIGHNRLNIQIVIQNDNTDTKYTFLTSADLTKNGLAQQQGMANESASPNPPFAALLFSLYYFRSNRNYQANTTNQSVLRDLIDWFKEEEDYENEQIRARKDFDWKNPQLEVIRDAILRFFSHLQSEPFSHLHIQRQGNGAPHIETNVVMVVKKGDTDLNIDQLSDGEKMLVMMIFEIAKHFNPHSDSDNVCLIDEIDKHLHPKWQRQVLPALTKTFPNIQFIITTHSPQVLSSVHGESVRILDNGVAYSLGSDPFGRNTDAILEEIFGVSRRPKDTQKAIDKYFGLIHKRKFDEAEVACAELHQFTATDDPIFLQADALIHRLKLVGK